MLRGHRGVGWNVVTSSASSPCYLTVRARQLSWQGQLSLVSHSLVATCRQSLVAISNA
jgi:hypothetical protein